MKTGLNILFITRASLFTVRGGDTTQIQKTAAALNDLSVNVDIKLCTEKNIDYSLYDLVHFFNILHPADMMSHIKKSRLPYVVSTIYVDYTRPSMRKTHGVRDLILNSFGRDNQEYIKTIGKSILQGKKIISPDYVWKGHRRSVQWVLENASLLLPNSENEYRRLFSSYGIQKKYSVIPNGADTTLFNCSDDDMRRKDSNMVLCVARIELIKNQLNLIKALNHTHYQLYLVGNFAPNHLAYYNECKKIAASNIHFINEMKQEELVDLYKRAKVHVLPSWFETTGLASLEALFCGCNIVVTACGDTTEYFDGEACSYCEPGSTASIRAAVGQAATRDANTSYINAMTQKFNWQKTAAMTLSAYQAVILNLKQ
jgi:glycosyltransferase involved in cell wall biosynthesis